MNDLMLFSYALQVQSIVNLVKRWKLEYKKITRLIGHLVRFSLGFWISFKVICIRFNFYNFLSFKSLINKSCKNTIEIGSEIIFLVVFYWDLWNFILFIYESEFKFDYFKLPI
jgi:hypothetical protein